MHGPGVAGSPRLTPGGRLSHACEAERDERARYTTKELSGPRATRIHELLRVADLGVTGATVVRDGPGQDTVKLTHHSAAGDVSFDRQEEPCCGPPPGATGTAPGEGRGPPPCRPPPSHPAAAPTVGRPRLLPWSNLDGNPCYLVTDDTGTGRLSRLADDVETVQLGMADDLLGHAVDLLGDAKATAPQLRFPAACLAEALHDVHRIARSRGARLPAPHGDAASDAAPEVAPGA